MKNLTKMILCGSAALMLGGCDAPNTESATSDFKYTIDSFADLKVMRYRIPGWENLSLQQKEYAYHLAEAAKYGRDILWDQNCKDNLRVRHALEAILENSGIDTQTPEYQDFLVYAKRVFFSNGIHHHYAEDKIFPACSKEYFASLLDACGIKDNGLLDIIYNPAVWPQRRSTETSGDLVKLSAVNYYEGVTREEVENYYAGIVDPSDPEPVSWGLNTKKSWAKPAKWRKTTSRSVPWVFSSSTIRPETSTSGTSSTSSG